jgi:hypothetical protein
MANFNAFAIAASLTAGLLIGLLHGDWRVRGIERDTAERIAEVVQQREELRGSLAATDLQLVNAQAKAADVREVEVIKQKVVYRDRIQTVTVRDCVDSSGILQLYNAAHGLPVAAE